MSVVQHPGPLLPGGPTLHLDVPDGWDVAPAPRAIAVARPAASPALQPGFVPNLTVTADLVPVGTTPDQILDAMLAQYPGTRGASQGAAGSALLTREHDSGTVRQRVDVLVDATLLPGGHQHAVDGRVELVRRHHPRPARLARRRAHLRPARHRRPGPGLSQAT